MKKQTNEQLKLNPEQIIGYCQENFINIVPNTCSNQSQSEPQRIQNRERHHEKDYLKMIMKQLSIFLQLTIQNCVLTSDPKIKSMSFKILSDFRDYLSQDLEHFENLIHHNNRTKLPFYEVDCKDFLGRELVVKIPPQVSLYQDPLLFYNYSKLAQEELFCNLPMEKYDEFSYQTRQERVEIIKNHVPFLNPIFIPVIEERFETKAKFNEVEDRLLLIFLTMHEKKDIPHYKQIYFSNRSEDQIKNRAKNLCAKEMINPIKTLKENEYLPLTEEERKILIKAYLRFGPRWPVISKYYNVRSSEMLEAEYERYEKLDKCRKFYDLKVDYPPIRTIIEKEISKEMAEPYNNDKEDVEIDLEEVEEKMEEEEQEPKYKIINHLTFLYEEI